MIHIIPPKTPHSKRAAAGFRDLYLHTDGLRRAGYAPQAEPPLAEPLILTDDASHTVESLMSILLSRYLLNSRIDAVTETLFDAVLQLIDERRREAAPDPVVGALVRVIASSYNNPEFQVTDALIATGYSKDHIRRRFHDVTGMTPNAYLTNVRMRYAQRLLSQRDKLRLPIREIALMCGYYDVAYFCRAFRKHTGETPSDYARGCGQ